MEQSTATRREFLAGATGTLGATLVAAHWPGIVSAHSHAAEMVASPQPTTPEFLSAAEAHVVDAIAAQIIPTDNTPGAREAGAVDFIDRSLRTWFAHGADDFRTRLKDFNARFAATHSGGNFAAADNQTQISFLEQVDKSPFFGTVRLLTLLGMLALPSYGGNRDGIGWRLLGFEDTHAFSPPFGHYDRDYPGFQVPEDGA